ncbi:hypothetical protein Ciccas_002790 [Cichlidogyrus casuarinus]|uniref:Uncharacterized protein n=1 Tax=Cichlidogyrus casuarinus TaxID=1844966 RepID=A0ABD2QG90_9PLAT
MWDLASNILSQQPVYDSGEYEMLEKCASLCMEYHKVLQNSKKRFVNFSTDMMMSFVEFENLLLEELTQRLIPVLSTIPAESHEYTQQLRKIQNKLSSLLNGLLGHSLAVCVHWEYTTSSDSIIRNSNNIDQVCASLQILNRIAHFFQNTLANCEFSFGCLEALPPAPHIRNDVMDDFMCWLVRTHVLLDIAKTGSVHSASSDSPLWVLIHLLARSEKEQNNYANSLLLLDPILPHWYPSYNFLTFCINVITLLSSQIRRASPSILVEGERRGETAGFTSHADRDQDTLTGASLNTSLISVVKFNLFQFLKSVSDRLAISDRLRLIRFFVHLLRMVNIQKASKHGINMTTQQDITWPTLLLTLLNNLTCGLFSCVVNNTQQTVDAGHAHNNVDMFLFDCAKSELCQEAQTLGQAKLLIEEVSMKVNFEGVSSVELSKVFHDLCSILMPGENQPSTICSLMIVAPVNTVAGKLFGLLAISAGIGSYSEQKQDPSLYPDVRRDDKTEKKCHYVRFIVQALMAAMCAMKKDYALRNKREQLTPTKQGAQKAQSSASANQNGWNPIHTIYNQYTWLYDNVLQRYGKENDIKAEEVRAQDRLNFFKQLCFLRILTLLSDIESAAAPLDSRLDTAHFHESSLMIFEFCRLLELDTYEAQLKKLTRSSQSHMNGLPSSHVSVDQLDLNVQVSQARHPFRSINCAHQSYQPDFC